MSRTRKPFVRPWPLRMGEYMDKILNKLTEIETAAGRIMDSVDADKKLLDQKYQKLQDEFDRQVDAETEARLLALKEDLSRDREEHLKGIRDAAKEELAHLDQLYQTGHEQLVDQLMQDILKV